jgi:orotidine-5'-phosphate decarboxylase
VTSVWAVLPHRSAEDAVRAAKALGDGCGLVVTPALTAGPGPAVVAALAAIGPVLVLAGLHGDAADAAVAGQRLVEYGASWVSVEVVGGPGLAGAVTAAIGGGRALAVTLWPGVDDATAAATRLGTSRGRVVSRLAAVASDAGMGAVLCEPADLGVVAQVASDLSRFVWGVGSADEAASVFERGVAAVIIRSEAVAGRDPGRVIERFLAVAPSG